MQILNNYLGQRGLLKAVLILSLAGCGGGGGGADGDGPAIQARPQTVAFAAAPVLPLGNTANFSATASSGLAIRYVAQTSSVCSVNAATGLVTALSSGDCTIAAIQDGNSTYAPARASVTVTVYVDPSQTITFAALPSISRYDMYTEHARASSALPVTYSSLMPGICSIDPNTGLATGLLAGSCTIAAHQAGTTSYPVYNPASQTHTFTVSPAAVPATIPGKPSGVSATLGASNNEVIVTLDALGAGGSPVTGFTVSSYPAGLSVTASSLPITINCGGSCTGYGFSLHATNAVGDGPESDAAHVVTAYYVVETIHEPATQPNDSIFIGAYDFDSTSRTVSNLRGYLTESMSGGCATIAGCPGSYGNVPMTMILTNYQLDSQAVTLGGVSGRLVTTFALNTTNTFFNSMGGDGWSPQHGVDVGGIYYGWPKAKNPYNGGVGNSSSTIFVNTTDPTIPLQQAQIDKLAYADCAYGGMMGAVCMTGTSIAGYGAVGTMGGYPVSQVTVRQCSDLNDLDTLHAQGRLSVGKSSFCQSLLSSHP